MNNNKDVIIAVLVTFCVTVTVFMVLPIRSANNSYDSWLDYNGDGKINLPDLVALASAYSTTGNPTRTVMLATDNSSYSWTPPNGYGPYYTLPYIETRGYSRIYLNILSVANRTIPYACNLTIGWIWNDNTVWHYDEIETYVANSVWRELDVKAPRMFIILGDTYADSYIISYYVTG